MTDRPIIFSAPMVRALLAGTKTQTRRIAFKGWTQAADGVTVPRETLWQHVSPSDRLWVREAWGLLPRNCYALPKTPAPDKDFAAYYRADFDRCGRPAWRTPIHMPRWASRLTLTVTDVRVQRLQEISEWDARAEGVSLPQNPQSYRTPCRLEFANLWSRIHGDGAWEANPEVVALTFTAEQRNIDAIGGGA